MTDPIVSITNPRASNFVVIQPARPEVMTDLDCRWNSACITWNNYTEDNVKTWESLVETVPFVVYVCYTREVGESGTPHLQGFIKTSKTVTTSWLCKLCPGIWATKTLATNVDKAIGYCHKKGEPEEIPLIEFGVRPKGAGHRTDLDMLHADILSGMSQRDVSNQHFGLYLRYSTGLQRYWTLNASTATRSEPKIYWLWGPSGTGKTQRISKYQSGSTIPPTDVPDASTARPEMYSLTHTTSGTWWDMYHGQTVVLLDDLRGSWMPYSDLLRIFQSSPCQVSARGVGHWLAASTFFVTTNLPPSELYSADMDTTALARRIADYAWVYHVGAQGCVLTSSPTRHSEGEINFS